MRPASMSGLLASGKTGVVDWAGMIGGSDCEAGPSLGRECVEGHAEFYTSQLVSAWQSSRLRPVISAQILDKYLRVLAYPKFELTPAEIRGLIDEVLRYVETARDMPAVIPRLRDPDDAKFINCALAAGVRWLVSGDNDLLSLHRVKSVEIVPVMTFLHHFKRKP